MLEEGGLVGLSPKIVFHLPVDGDSSFPLTQKGAQRSSLV